MDDEKNIVELVDENGEKTAFEHIMTIEYKDQKYVLLRICGDTSNEEADIVILRIEQDENEEDVYVTIESDKELNEVFDIFKELIEQN